MRNSSITTPAKTLILKFLEKYPLTWYQDKRLYSYVESYWGRKPSGVAIRQALSQLREGGYIKAKAFYNPKTKKPCYVYAKNKDFLYSRDLIIYLLDTWLPNASIYQQMALVHKWGGVFHIAKAWKLEDKRLTIPEDIL